MESTTVRTDFCKNEKGEHVIVRTTMTVKRKDEVDETVSDELHTTEETVPYVPAAKEAIDKSKPASKVGKDHVDESRTWTDNTDSPASKWPAEMR